MGTDGKEEKELRRGGRGRGLSESHNTAKHTISYARLCICIYISCISVYDEIGAQSAEMAENRFALGAQLP